MDLAVQLVAKEIDFDRLQEANAEQLAILGRFGSFLEEQFCWFLETLQFLKGCGRVITLADYNMEKRMVLAVPASDAARRARGASTGTCVESTATGGVKATTARVPILKP